MTIEKLVDCSLAELKALSDADIETHFKRYLPTTRPAMVQKETKSSDSIRSALGSGNKTKTTTKKVDVVDQAKAYLAAFRKQTQ